MTTEGVTPKRVKLEDEATIVAQIKSEYNDRCVISHKNVETMLDLMDQHRLPRYNGQYIHKYCFEYFDRKEEILTRADQLDAAFGVGREIRGESVLWVGHPRKCRRVIETYIPIKFWLDLTYIDGKAQMQGDSYMSFLKHHPVQKATHPPPFQVGRFVNFIASIREYVRYHLKYYPEFDVRADRVILKVRRLNPDTPLDPRIHRKAKTKTLLYVNFSDVVELGRHFEDYFPFTYPSDRVCKLTMYLQLVHGLSLSDDTLQTTTPLQDPVLLKLFKATSPNCYKLKGSSNEAYHCVWHLQIDPIYRQEVIRQLDAYLPPVLVGLITPYVTATH